MPFNHTPAEVVRRALTDNGVGSFPAPTMEECDPWPIYASGEPDKPDACITTYDTPGIDLGRVQIDGERVEALGIQIRIRAAQHSTGYRKAEEVRDVVDKEIYRTQVTIGSDVYLLVCINRETPIVMLGRERGSSRRLFTINALATIRQLE